MGRTSIWTNLKGQIILGEDSFTERFIGYIKGHNDIKEIPKTQRYINRQSLDNLFKREVLRDKNIRNDRILEAIEGHGYTQKEIADYLKMHYSTISRLVNKKEVTSKSKT